MQIPEKSLGRYMQRSGHAPKRLQFHRECSEGFTKQEWEKQEGAEGFQHNH